MKKSGLFLLLWMVAMAANAGGRAYITGRGVDSLHVVVGVADGKHNLPGEGYGVADSAYYFQYYKYTYPSVDAHGDSVMLSALAAFPYGDEIHPDNVLIGCHITITDNDQAPSEFIDHGSMTSDVRMLIGHARGNKDARYCKNLVIIPDFLGYGVTADKPHPYLYEELTARNVVDATRHGIDLFLGDSYEAEGAMVQRSFASDDWKTVITGYSQGGAVALAVHKFIETNGLADELHLLGSVCGAGPYDPVATLRWYCSTGKVYLPVVIPLMLKGMVDANPYLNNYAISDILTEKFLATGIVDMIADKNLTTAEIDNALLAWSARSDTEFKLYKPDGTPYGGTTNESTDVYARIEDCLQPDILAYFMDDSHFTRANDPLKRTPDGHSLAIDMHKALESNNLTVGWKPEHRMLIFHSEGDEVVPYENARSAMEKLHDDCLVRHIRYTNSSEARMRHSSVGTTFFFALFGLSVEEKAIDMLYRSLDEWKAYGTDTWE